MQKFEEIIIHNNPSLNFCKRFVDDSLSAFPEVTYEELLENMNLYNKSFQFTCERETKMEIAFFGLHLRRDHEGKLHRRVYPKLTATGRSFRAFIICDEDAEEELQNIRSDLIMNDYPLNYINRRIKKMREKTLQSRQRSICITDEKRHKLILQCMGILTTRITNYFRDRVDCDFGYTLGTQIGSLIFNQKQKALTNPSGIYTITCSCRMTYIGESGRPYTNLVEDYFRKQPCTTKTNLLHRI